MLGMYIRRSATGACRSAPTYKNACYGRLCVLLSCVAVATARPIRRDSSSSSGSNNSVLTTWIPVAVVVMVIVAVFVFSWSKAGRRLIGRVRGMAAGTSVTAEQLAGSSTPAATPARPRRAPRRRASQISTKSLPAYMEEPGDNELVLVRRAPTEDDEGLLASSSPGDSISIAATPSPDENQSTTMNGMLTSSTDDHIRPSMETSRTELMGSDESSTSLMHSLRRHFTSDTTPSDAAPSYLEVVTPEEIQRRSVELSRVHSVSSEETMPDPGSSVSVPTAPTARPPNPRRRSGFMNIFHARSPSGNEAEPAPASSSRPNSTVAPDRTSWLPRTTPQRATHAPSTSMTSLLSLRSTSPQPTPHSLTSPSVTSLSSLVISAPLTHTLMHTEFSYPRSGPTPEQIKFISSRESLGRFGVPFGAEARAAAAAARTSSEQPPPFEEGENESREGVQSASPIVEQVDAATEAQPRSEEEVPQHASSEIEDSSNQATIRVHPHPSYPPLPSSANASSPIVDEHTPTRPNHIPLPSLIPADDDPQALEVSIIPATPTTSLPNTPIAHTPPPVAV